MRFDGLVASTATTVRDRDSKAGINKTEYLGQAGKVCSWAGRGNAERDLVSPVRVKPPVTDLGWPLSAVGPSTVCPARTGGV